MAFIFVVLLSMTTTFLSVAALYSGSVGLSVLVGGILLAIGGLIGGLDKD